MPIAHIVKYIASAVLKSCASNLPDNINILQIKIAHKHTPIIERR
jgi:hypothetical protein